MEPLVSILVPAFNAEPFLKGCLDSILAQSHGRCQVAIVDDGSTDATAVICQDYARRHACIDFVSAPHAGVAAARNRLLSIARGEYLLFVDADDRIDARMVEKLLACRADIAVCSMDLFPQTAAVYDRQQAIVAFLRHDPFHGKLTNKLLRRSLLDGLSFDPEIAYGEDAWMVWQALQRADRVVVTDETLYHSQLHAGSISAQPFSLSKMGASEVWRRICADVATDYPEYLPLALGRWGMEDLSLLRLAALANWPCDENVKLLQSGVKTHLPMITQQRLATDKERFYAWMAARWYFFGRIYLWMHNLRRT